MGNSVLFPIFQEVKLIFQKKIELFLFPSPPSSWSCGLKGNVLVIPGFLGTWQFFRKIGNHLSQQGYRIHTISALGFNLLPLKQSTDIVSDYITRHELHDLIVITHSKGGIIVMGLFKIPFLASRIKRCVTIAAPYGGTIFGYFGIFSLFELIPQSPIIRDFHPTPEFIKKIVNIYPKLDELVLPNKNLLLRGGINILIPISGHIRILESTLTLQQIDKALINV